MFHGLWNFLDRESGGLIETSTQEFPRQEEGTMVPGSRKERGLKAGSGTTRVCNAEKFMEFSLVGNAVSSAMF